MFGETGFIQHLHSQPAEERVCKISRFMDIPDLLRALKCHANDDILQDLTKLNKRHILGIGVSV